LSLVTSSATKVFSERSDWLKCSMRVGTQIGESAHQRRTYFLPRLPREYYQGDAVVHWTLTIVDHVTGWLSDFFHSNFRELMLHAAVREGLFCPVYCLMPDHIHLLWMGLRLETDQRNGMAFLRTHLKPMLVPARFQPQAHDHVLRAEDRRKNAFARGCRYILENPVRAGIVKGVDDWKFMGAIVPGYPKLDPRENDYWRKFWKFYATEKRPDAGDIVRPPFNIQPSARPPWNGEVW
jgi:putative transposase